MRLRLLLIAGGAALCLCVAASAQGDHDRTAPSSPVTSDLEKQVRKLACAASQSMGVPPEIIEGVILAENVLNRGWIDDAQDAMVRFFLIHRDEGWWEKWAEEGARMAAASIEARRLSNKWPTTLILSGYVTSIGLAQITPRTAIIACASKRKSCPTTPKQLLEYLLDPAGAAAIAAVVLDHEAEQFRRWRNMDVRQDPGLWATLYNAGGDFIAARTGLGAPLPVNAFGRWVAERVAQTHGSFHCDPTTPAPG
jgi:hypothetical protein